MCTCLRISPSLSKQQLIKVKQNQKARETQIHSEKQKKKKEYCIQLTGSSERKTQLIPPPWFSSTVFQALAEGSKKTWYQFTKLTEVAGQGDKGVGMKLLHNYTLNQSNKQKNPTKKPQQTKPNPH